MHLNHQDHGYNSTNDKNIPKETWKNRNECVGVFGRFTSQWKYALQ
jgi:hypothetical protein